MQTSTVASVASDTAQTISCCDKILEKAPLVGKIAGVATAVLAVAAAAYVAPVIVVLSSLAVVVLSIVACRIALSGYFSNPETAKKVIIVALIATAIALGGTALGLTPIFGAMFVGAFQATSVASAVVQLVFSSFMLTTIGGYLGGMSRSAFESAFELPTRRIDLYLQNQENGDIKTPGKFWDAICMFGLLAFKNETLPLMSFMPDAAKTIHTYTATDEELKKSIHYALNAISTNMIIFEHYRDVSLCRDQIAIYLSVATEILKLCSEDTASQCYHDILDVLPKVAAIEEFEQDVEKFLDDNQVELFALCEKYKTGVQPHVKIAELDVNVIEIEEGLEAPQPDLTDLSQKLFDIQSRLRELKHDNAKYMFLFGEQDAILQDNNRNIASLFSKVDKCAIALDKQKAKANAGKAQINKEDAVSDVLMINAMTQEKVEKVLEALKQALQVATDGDIATKMDQLGIGTVEDLYKKNIVTEEDLQQRPEEAQEKIIEHIKTLTNEKVDLRSRIYQVLSAAYTHAPNANQVYNIASQAVYRVAMACAILAPMIIAPYVALVGLAAGVIAFTAYRLIEGEPFTLQQTQRIGVEHSCLNYFDRFGLTGIISIAARRTLFGFDDDSQRDVRAFVQADIFGKMRLLSWELGIASLMSYIAQPSQGYYSPELVIVELLAPFIQGGVLGREGVEVVSNMVS